MFFKVFSPFCLIGLYGKSSHLLLFEHFLHSLLLEDISIPLSDDNFLKNRFAFSEFVYILRSRFEECFVQKTYSDV